MSDDSSITKSVTDSIAWRHHQNFRTSKWVSPLITHNHLSKHSFQFSNPVSQSASPDVTLRNKHFGAIATESAPSNNNVEDSEKTLIYTNNDNDTLVSSENGAYIDDGTDREDRHMLAMRFHPVNSLVSNHETVIQDSKISSKIFSFPIERIQKNFVNNFDFDLDELVDLKFVINGSNSNIFSAVWKNQLVILKVMIICYTICSHFLRHLFCF